MVNQLVTFLDQSPSAFGAIASIRAELEKHGYQKLDNAKIEKGKKYYTERNETSIIAFNVGSKLESPSLQIAASHSDCPTFKLKPNPIIKSEYGARLNVEVYGGILTRAYFDRPLSLAGRVILKKQKSITSVVYVDKKPFCIMPSMAPHLCHSIEDKKADVAIDLVPIVSLNKDYDFKEYLVKNLNVDKQEILGFDLYLYPLQKGYVWGENDEFVTSNHLDNLECAYCNLMGFLDIFHENNINLYACFDNEEVGSLTRQGADSDLLESTILRICDDLNLNYRDLVDNGMLLSCDNAHGVHPNHPELYDKDNAPVLNKGIAIKFNANQSYTSDSLSCALLTSLLKDNNIPFQLYCNKTGIRGGGTLGNLSSRHVSIMSVDIGLPQWAMHSCIETAGSKDVDSLIAASKCFYSHHLLIQGNTYQFKE